jgi:hypothetical protein
MNELIREIEEDIRRENAQKLWMRFGKLMMAVSLAVILGTAAGVLWKEHKQSVAAVQTSQLMRGIDQFNAGDFKGAASAFDALTDDSSSPYYGMAMLRKAKAQAASGDNEGAARTYQILAKHNAGESDAAFVDLARLEAASTSEGVIDAQKGSPFYYTLAEWKAWKQIKLEKKDEALALFKTLAADEKTPASMRARAKLVLEHFAPEKKALAHE